MSLPDTKALAWRVVGRVQGVGFRYWTRQQAQRLDLRGIVRNVADGSVIVAAKGSAHSLDKLRELLQNGPPGAVVQALEPVVTPEEELPFPFEIRR
jgi:acylphosphatase